MRAVNLVITIFIFGAGLLSGQGLPDKIDGYKVQKAAIYLRSEADRSAMPAKSDAVLVVGTPKVVDLGLSGLTLELPMRFAAVNRSGKADRITFHDLRVNGLAIAAEPQTQPFSFQKGKPIVLPVPPRLKVPASSLVKAAYKELTGPVQVWRVTGTAFLFGRFKKFGMTFKRVVPVTLDLEIPNPIAR